MCKRILILLAVTLMAMGCGRGVKPMPAPASTVPNLDIPADLLTREPGALPQPEGGSRSQLLTNHVAVAWAYHALAIDYVALVCAVTGQQGITVNGAMPRRPGWCDARVFRDMKTSAQPVDMPVDKLGPSGTP